MLPTLLAITAIIIMVALWLMSTQRRLVMLDENINNAITQIGVQLSGRFDALTALLNITKSYFAHESETLLETLKSKRNVITAKSTPGEIIMQEGFISEVFDRISMFTKKYPELNEDPNYIRAVNAVQTFEDMLCTSRLIYNDSVNKLNSNIRMFPVSIIAGVLGFSKRDYWDD